MDLVCFITIEYSGLVLHGLRAHLHYKCSYNTALLAELHHTLAKRDLLAVELNHLPELHKLHCQKAVFSSFASLVMLAWVMFFPHLYLIQLHWQNFLV